MKWSLVFESALAGILHAVVIAFAIAFVSIAAMLVVDVLGSVAAFLVLGFMGLVAFGFALEYYNKG